jgi:shikimate kinase
MSPHYSDAFLEENTALRSRNEYSFTQVNSVSFCIASLVFSSKNTSEEFIGKRLIGRKMIITLCGFMGCGKSTLGRGLAAACNCRFIDLDDYIEDKWAMSVSSIFAKNGEEWFREQERECLLEIVDEYRYLSSKEPYTLVLALGGGTVTYGPSVEVVQDNTHCVYLKCPKEVLLGRLVKNNSRRPLLAGKSEEEISASIDDLMASREQAYIDCAKWVYNTGEKKMGGQLKDFMEKFRLERKV